MIKVKAEEIEIKDDITDEIDQTGIFSHPLCFIDFSYTSNLEDDYFRLNLEYTIKVMDDDVSVFAIHYPYTLRYSHQAYEEYGLNVILQSAVFETQQDVFAKIYTPYAAFLFAKAKFLGKEVH